MNDPNAGPQPPPAYSPLAGYPPPKKGFPVVPVILGVVGLLIVLGVAGGVTAFRSAQKGSSAAVLIGNSFVDNMGQHNYSAARSLFTPAVQSHTPAGSLEDVEALAEKHHGAFVNHGQPQWFIQNWNGQTSVRLTYPVQFTKETSRVTLTLVETDEGYQVYDAHYDF